MIILKLLALGYLVFFAVTVGTYLLMLYERARDAGPDAAEAHVPLLRYLGQIFVEAGANYLTWLLWPAQFLDRAAPVRLAGTNRHPILFVHGYVGHSANFLVLRSRLRSAGLDCFATYNYRTTVGDVAQMAEELSRQVERVKLESGAEQIDVVGHSLGGLILVHYLANLGGTEHVRKGVLIASPLAGTRLVPFLPRHAFELLHPQAAHIQELRQAAGKIKGTRLISIYSTGDNLVIPGASGKLPGKATSHELHELGHNAMLFSGRVVELLRSELSEA